MTVKHSRPTLNQCRNQTSCLQFICQRRLFIYDPVWGLVVALDVVGLSKRPPVTSLGAIRVSSASSCGRARRAEGRHRWPEVDLLTSVSSSLRILILCSFAVGSTWREGDSFPATNRLPVRIAACLYRQTGPISPSGSSAGCRVEVRECGMAVALDFRARRVRARLMREPAAAAASCGGK
jgi:hypothetical protein